LFSLPLALAEGEKSREKLLLLAILPLLPPPSSLLLSET
jgi:hypothetical protein